YIKMVQLAWRTHPSLLITIIVLQIFSGSLPAISAWNSKQLMDFLSHNVNIQPTERIFQSILPILAIYILLLFLVSGLDYINSFLTAEMNRKLSLEAQTQVYQKTIRLDGLAYFENPAFHDTLRMSASGVQTGPQQILAISTRLISSASILLSFSAVVVNISPVLFGLIAVFGLFQLYIQKGIVRRKVKLAYDTSPLRRRAFYVGDLISNVYFAEEVLFFNLGNYLLKRYREMTASIHTQERKQQTAETLRNASMSAMYDVLYCGALLVVVYRVVFRIITVGDFILYISAITSIQSAVNSIVLAIAELNQNALFLQYFDELGKLPTVKCDPVSGQ